MTTAGILGVASGGFGLVGSVILAFSLGSVIRTLQTCWLAHETTIEQFLGSGHVPHFTGLEKHIDASKRTSARLTTVGLLLLVVAFALQIASAVA